MRTLEKQLLLDNWINYRLSIWAVLLLIRRQIITAMHFHSALHTVISFSFSVKNIFAWSEKLTALL